MSDMDRFTDFLLEVVAAYHRPPETPREEMWTAIEAGLEGGPAEGAGDPLLAAAGAYHEPPAPPVDDMWGRIEAAWALRSGAPEGAREAGLDELTDVPWRDAERGTRPDRGRIARWATGVAVAAALVIGIAIGRTSLGDPEPAGTRVTAADPGPAVTLPGTTDTVADSDLDGGSARGDDSRVEPLESGVRLAAESAARDDGDPAATNGTTSRTPAARGSSRDVALRIATARHMERAETLLTAFETGLESDDTGDLASWARTLLGETRLLLDSSSSRPARERSLLEELELVLAQIAGLSDDAPGFERDLIVKGLERQGTIARLRAAAPSGVGGPLTGT